MDIGLLGRLRRIAILLGDTGVKACISCVIGFVEDDGCGSRQSGEAQNRGERYQPNDQKAVGAMPFEESAGWDGR